MSVKHKLVDLPPISLFKRQSKSNSTKNLSNKLMNLIPLDQTLTDRWDKEWLHYFLTEDPRPFFLSHQNLEFIDDISEKEPIEVYSTQLFSVEGFGKLPALSIWVHGNQLVGKNVLEIGPGPGFLGKQIGKIANAYLGIDYSQLALSIARLTSPPNCSYYHISEIDRIVEHAGTMDMMVGRHFFIHQNYQNLIWLLELAAVLLKSGGLISADFYLGNPAIPQGIIYPARHELDERYPSCGFAYSIEDIEQAAKETNLTVENITDNLDLQRRFVFFKKL